MKTCPKCKTIKAAVEFNKNRSRNDGLSNYCKICFKVAAAASYLKHKQARLKVARDWKQNNKAAVAAYMRKWESENREHRRNYGQTLAMFESKRKYRQENRARYLAHNRKRELTKTHATPTWLSVEQINQLVKIYEECPKGYQVDHIVPLQGREVRGLHVPWNLQYLTRSENIRKGNKLV